MACVKVLETIDGRIGLPRRWIVTVNGFQHGGEYDRSGAGDLTFETRKEAARYAAALRQRDARRRGHCGGSVREPA